MHSYYIGYRSDCEFHIPVAGTQRPPGLFPMIYKPAAHITKEYALKMHVLTHLEHHSGTKMHGSFRALVSVGIYPNTVFFSRRLNEAQAAVFSDVPGRVGDPRPDPTTPGSTQPNPTLSQGQWGSGLTPGRMLALQRPDGDSMQATCTL